MNLPESDLDRLFSLFARLPSDLQHQVLIGLEQLAQGDPDDLTRLDRLVGAFGRLSPGVRHRLADAVEALQAGDLAGFSRQTFTALQAVRLERRLAGLRVRPAGWTVETCDEGRP